MFNEEKATELAACMLSWGGSMKFIKLLKLIYLADREALDREGHSISTDRWVSMKHGPVPIQTYNLIHQEDDPDRHPVWNQYIENQADYCIGLKKEMGINHLSEAERAVAEDVWKQYGHLPYLGFQWSCRAYSPSPRMGKSRRKSARSPSDTHPCPTHPARPEEERRRNPSHLGLGTDGRLAG